MSQPHVQRMVTERNELAERTLKVGAFLKEQTFAELQGEDQDLLTAQYAAMGLYQTILNIRLGRALTKEKAL